MSLLTVNNLTVSFGGLKALDGIDIHIDIGEIVGIIGPNGSGKTTLFNAITGVYQASAGSIHFAGTDITNAPADHIARLGVARTFQRVRLLESLSVFDNLLAGFHGRRNPSLLRALQRSRMQQDIRELEERAAATVSLFSPSLVERFYEPVSGLPYIDRRRIEICRALAGEPRLLFLDEPAAGMSPEETKELMDDLHKAADALPDITIVIIEHDMAVIRGVSQRVICLNHGRKIAEGDFNTVATHPEVRSAYLGSEAHRGTTVA